MCRSRISSRSRDSAHSWPAPVARRSKIASARRAACPLGPKMPPGPPLAIQSAVEAAKRRCARRTHVARTRARMQPLASVIARCCGHCGRCALPESRPCCLPSVQTRSCRWFRCGSRFGAAKAPSILADRATVGTFRGPVSRPNGALRPPRALLAAVQAALVCVGIGDMPRVRGSAPAAR